MATHAAPRNISGLARAMVQHGLLSEYDAETLQNQAQAANVGFVEQTVTSRRMTAAQVAIFASRAFGTPLLDLSGFDVAHIEKGLVDPKMATTRRVLPLHKRGNRLFVAVSDPANLQALDEVRFKTNLVIDPVVVEDDKLGLILAEYSKTIEEKLEVGEVDLTTDLEDAAKAATEEANPDVDDAPVVRYIQKILLDAIAAGVSDIHFEPYEKFYRVRYRLDGELMEVAQPPLAIKEKVASRIKVISRLDISEKRVPQDGRMKLVLSKNRAIDFRVSTLPTLYGEKLVLRILDSAGVKLGIEVLGYEPNQQKLLLEAIKRPYGMILVTGPTGSGKTVSLYTCLNILNEPGINISTAEDPAEIQLAGVNQVNVNEKAGLTFATALRAFLRQDPDIIMVGEIRDLETAENAVQAALTGHLVFSTLHTNDAPSSITRLLDLGLPAYLIASTVIGIMAQRLVRRICRNCEHDYELLPEEAESVGLSADGRRPIMVKYGEGCSQCRGTGYQGRTGIYEVLEVNEKVRPLITDKADAESIKRTAVADGMVPLREAAVRKMINGETTFDEVIRVTGEKF